MNSSLLELENWKLGDTSEKYESARRGPGTISNGKGDNGGKSYGTFQLSLSAGTLNDFLESPAHGRYADQFNNIEKGSTQFDKKWKELALTDPQFKENQYQFIKTTHYERQMQNLQENGIQLSSRGPAVQDLVWSTATQYGLLTTPIFQKTLAEAGLNPQQVQQLSDLDLIVKVQQYKKDHVPEHFTSSSPEIQKNIQEQRIPKETKDLIKLNTAHIERISKEDPAQLYKTPSSPIGNGPPVPHLPNNTLKIAPEFFNDGPTVSAHPNLQVSHYNSPAASNLSPTNNNHSALPLTAGFTRQHDSIFQQIASQFQETSTKFMDAIGLNAEQRQQFSKMAQQQLEQKLPTFITQAIGQLIQNNEINPPQAIPSTPDKTITPNNYSQLQNASVIPTLTGREKFSTDSTNQALAGTLSPQQIELIKQFFSPSPEQANKISPPLEQRR